MSMFCLAFLGHNSKYLRGVREQRRRLPRGRGAILIGGNQAELALVKLSTKHPGHSSKLPESGSVPRSCTLRMLQHEVARNFHLHPGKGPTKLKMYIATSTTFSHAPAFTFSARNSSLEHSCHPGSPRRAFLAPFAIKSAGRTACWRASPRRRRRRRGHGQGPGRTARRARRDTA